MDVTAKKQNRSKYNFGSYQVGDEIEVDVLDMHSMLSSLGSFNRRHGREIAIDPTGVLSKQGKMVCKITKI